MHNFLSGRMQFCASFAQSKVTGQLKKYSWAYDFSVDRGGMAVIPLGVQFGVIEMSTYLISIDRE